MTKAKSQSLPKHKRLTRAILGYIKRNNLKFGDKTPSEREFAKMLGVSPVTISKSLSELVEENILCRHIGSGTYISDSPAAKQLLSVCRFGLATRYNDDDQYAIEIAKGFNTAITEAGLEQLTIYQNHDSYLHNMHQHNLMGLAVIAPLHSSVEQLKSIRNIAPLAIIGAQYDTFEDITFTCDDKSATSRAVEYLHSLGHEKIAILTAYPHNALEVRLTGYQEGMYNMGLPIHPSWVISTSTYEVGVNEEIITKFSQLIKSEHAPTAVIAPTGNLLLNAFIVAEQMKLNVPNDLSIIGIDEIPRGQYISTPPTTFIQPLEQIGYAAGKYLIAKFYKEETDAIHLYKPDLIERQSCGPVDIARKG